MQYALIRCNVERLTLQRTTYYVPMTMRNVECTICTMPSRCADVLRFQLALQRRILQ